MKYCETQNRPAISWCICEYAREITVEMFLYSQSGFRLCSWISYQVNNLQINTYIFTMRAQPNYLKVLLLQQLLLILLLWLFLFCIGFSYSQYKFYWYFLRLLLLVVLILLLFLLLLLVLLFKCCCCPACFYWSHYQLRSKNSYHPEMRTYKISSFVNDNPIDKKFSSKNVWKVFFLYHKSSLWEFFIQWCP